MSKDYKTTPLRICADAQGGPDVDVSATLFVDDETAQAGSVTLPDVHIARQCADLEARKKSGEVKLRLLLVVVPLAGNGEFTATVELTHPNIPKSPRTLTFKGDVGGGAPKSVSRTFVMP